MRWCMSGKIMMAFVISPFMFLNLSFSETSIKLEAEEGKMNGVQVISSTPGFSGKGYVTGFDQEGDSVEVTVTIKEEGFYPLYIGYIAPNGEKGNRIVVNGKGVGSRMFAATNTIKEFEFGNIKLNSGKNTIAMVKDWGWMDVDYFRIGQKEERKEMKPITSTLVNPKASTEAKALMSYLCKNYGKQILSGQQSGPLHEKEFIQSLTGKLPVIYGFDYLGDKHLETLNAIRWAKQGGIVTFSWHWRAPKDGNEFYTRQTKFDVSKAVTPGTEEYKLIIRDMDEVAGYLKKLQDAKVPILWRPLHEAEGGWFWWGAKGAEPCMKLWKMMYERYTNHHQLNNLIWVWTDHASPKSNAWYPGDEYVDILGVDHYPPNKDYNPALIPFDEVVKRTNGKKLVAMTENGPIPDPDECNKYKVGWSYFVTWSGEMITGNQRNGDDHIIKVFQHPYVLTLDEFPSKSIYGKSPLPIKSPAPMPVAAPVAKGFTLYEAEKGKLNNTTINHYARGYSGEGFVAGFNQDNSSLELTVTVPQAGEYPVMIRYAAIFENHPNTIFLNGESLGDREFYHTPTFRDFFLGNLKMKEGKNILKIQKKTGYIEIDAILVGEQNAKPVIPEFRIVTGGKQIDFFHGTPYLDKENKVMVPVNDLADTLDWNYQWDENAKSVTIQKGQLKFTLTVGQKSVLLKVDILYAPLSLMAESMNKKIHWDKDFNFIDLM